MSFKFMAQKRELREYRHIVPGNGLRARSTPANITLNASFRFAVLLERVIAHLLSERTVRDRITPNLQLHWDTLLSRFYSTSKEVISRNRYTGSMYISLVLHNQVTCILLSKWGPSALPFFDATLQGQIFNNNILCSILGAEEQKTAFF